MFVENSKTAFRNWLTNLVGVIIISTVLILFYVGQLFSGSWFKDYRIYVVLILSLVYLYLVLKPQILKYQFLFVSDEGGKLEIKYYNLGFFPGSHKSFVFPKKEFHKFEVTRSFFKLREQIHIYRKVARKIVKYPPLSLSGLKPTEKNKLFTLLKRLPEN